MKSHKSRNKLTSIIYALSLGCIIFLLTASNLQVQTISMSAYTANADIEVKGHGCEIYSNVDTCFHAKDIDPVLEKWQDRIKDFGYVTGEMKKQIN